MTNWEWLKSQPVEKVAEVLPEASEVCNTCGKLNTCTDDGYGDYTLMPCELGFLKWLNREYKEPKQKKKKKEKPIDDWYKDL